MHSEEDEEGSHEKAGLLETSDDNNSEERVEVVWDRKQAFIIMVGCGIGCFLDFYAFGLIGYFEKQISAAFFPDTTSNNLELLESFTLYGIAFIMRPFGGLLFGYIADKHGRVYSLRLSIIMIAIPTFLMGCCPTYDDMGYAATAIVFILRCIQGLSAGGEFTGALVYIVENGPKKQLGLYMTLLYCMSMGSILGAVLYVVLNVSMPTDAFYLYGWRIPFLISILVSLYAMFLRRWLPLSIEFEAAEREQRILKNPIRYVFKYRKREMAILTFGMLPPGIAYFVTLTWLPAWIAAETEDPYAYDVLILCYALAMSVIIAGGYISDRIGFYRYQMPALCVATFLLFVSFSVFNSTANNAMISICQVIAAIAMGLTVPMFTFFAVYITDVRIRATLLGVAYNLGMALFESYVFDANTALMEVSKQWGGVFVALYMCSMLVAGIVAMVWGKRHSWRAILDENDSEMMAPLGSEDHMHNQPLQPASSNEYDQL